MVRMRGSWHCEPFRHVGTGRLLCSSFWVMTCFLKGDCNILHIKGAT